MLDTYISGAVTDDFTVSALYQGVGGGESKFAPD